jgi:hypothetical protein
MSGRAKRALDNASKPLPHREVHALEVELDLDEAGD